MRRLYFVMGFLSLFAAGMVQAQAQAVPNYENGGDAHCSKLRKMYVARPGDVTACANGHTNYQSLINVSTTIRELIGRRFTPQPNLAGATDADLNSRQAGQGSLQQKDHAIVIPTADILMPPASLWNVWADGKYSWIDGKSRYSGMDGPQDNILLGADYKIRSNVVVGIIGGYEHSRQKSSGFLPLRVRSNSWGGGIYSGWSITENLVYSSNLMLTSLRRHEALSGRHHGWRAQSSQSLTYYYYNDTWRFAPSVSYAWSYERQRAHGGARRQTSHIMLLSPGFQLGKSIAVADRTTMEPWAGLQLDWAIRDRVKEKGRGTILKRDKADLRVQGGLNFAFGGNAQLSLTGEVAGLLRKDHNTYTGGANFAYQF